MRGPDCDECGGHNQRGSGDQGEPRGSTKSFRVGKICAGCFPTYGATRGESPSGLVALGLMGIVGNFVPLAIGIIFDVLAEALALLKMERPEQRRCTRAG